MAVQLYSVRDAPVEVVDFPVVDVIRVPRGTPSGDAEQARSLLGQALDTARELGLANVERRATARLEGIAPAGPEYAALPLPGPLQREE